jgi:hypothetical protein
MSRLIWKILLGVAVMGVGVYVYYTEVKPVVIFGLRSDYAKAIPYQTAPAGPPAGLIPLRTVYPNT